MADVVSLAAYRTGLRVDGTTLVWHELRHTLEGPDVLDFCRELDATNDDGRTRAAAGFRMWADKRHLWIAGWSMGPMTMRRGDEVRRLGIALLSGERRRVGREGPVTA